MTAHRSLGVCVAVCAAMTLPVAVAAGAFPGANGRIAYVEWRQKDVRPHADPWRLSFWSRRPDGTRPQRIVRHATALNFSADGSLVVFARAGGIGVARADGGDRSWLLGHSPVASDTYWGAWWAAFSPDGTQVAYHIDESDPFRYGTNLYVIGVDGANPRRIAVDASHPVFSPDGSRIAYIAHLGVREAENHTTAIETMAVDGTDRRRLQASRSDSSQWTTQRRLDFAPDGSRMVFVETRDFHLRRIVILDAQTGERTQLPARVTGPVWDAVWSPDGRRIAFTHVHGDRVFTIRPDGTGKRLAFTVPVSKYGYIDALAWQPRP